MIGLGIDAGGSSARWLLLDDDGNELGGGRTGGITGHLYREAGAPTGEPAGASEAATARGPAAARPPVPAGPGEAAQAEIPPGEPAPRSAPPAAQTGLSTEGDTTLHRLRHLLGEVQLAARPDAVVAGVAGLEEGTAAAVLLQRVIAEELGLDPAVVQVVNDMRIAYASAFKPGQGILLYAGTGSIAYHLREDGTVLRAGGHGYLIDDAGGGFWIGSSALRAVLRNQDELGRRPDDPLARELFEELGGDDWNALRAEVYGQGRSRLAALAPAVARAAEQGDAVAREILERAGRELARLAVALQDRLEERSPVAFAGGISHLSPLLREALVAALPPDTRLTSPASEPVEAAARLALSARTRG